MYSFRTGQRNATGPRMTIGQISTQAIITTDRGRGRCGMELPPRLHGGGQVESDESLENGDGNRDAKYNTNWKRITGKASRTSFQVVGVIVRCGQLFVSGEKPECRYMGQLSLDAVNNGQISYQTEATWRGIKYILGCQQLGTAEPRFCAPTSLQSYAWPTFL
jgi:hypothetical protein